MSTIINVRSPFYYVVSPAAPESDIANVSLDLFIYTGTKVTDKGDAKYQLVKERVTDVNSITFEISELIRDYLEIEFNGTYSSQTVWVRMEYDINIIGGGTESGTDDYIALDGFGYFQEGINPEPSRTSLISNKTIYRINDQSIRVPVFTEDTESVSFLLGNEVVKTIDLSDASVDETDEQITYASVSAADVDSYKQRVLEDGGTFESQAALNDFLNGIDLDKVDKVYINSASGTEVLDVKTELCNKYTPFKVTFVNKFGALQDIFFTAKSSRNITFSGENYKSNIVNLNAPSYDIYRPQQAQYNKSAKESITLNTGFLNEEYNEVLKELFMSEQVWLTQLTDTDLVLAVIPKQQSLALKTSLNDYLIQYTVSFDFASDLINQVR